MFKYILRLLAGKFGRICTAFPLTTFSTKKFKIASLEFFRQKNVHITLCKSKKISISLSFQIFLITLHNFSSLRFKVQFFNQRSFSLSRFGLKNFLHKMIWTDFYTTITQYGKLNKISKACLVAEKKDLFQPFNTF